MDKNLAIQKLADRFAKAEQLIQAFEELQDKDGFSPSEYLLVVDSDFYGSRWKQLDVKLTQSNSEANAWHNSASPLKEALQYYLSMDR